MRQPVQELIERYQNNLYAIAFNICKNQADAEDVVQDTLIQYYTTSKDFEDEQHIRAWLLRVAINKAKNKKKSKFQLRYEELMRQQEAQSRSGKKGTKRK